MTMKMAYGGSLRRDLGRLFDGQSVSGLGEAQLLDRFVERRDEPAFEALVARHGPMVLGVCRRLLADPRDVEDAFQATFLVLVRRAGSIRSRDRLAPWLFGVARKVASRTRTDVARRQAKEYQADDEFASPPDGFDRELNQALLEEIDRLPDSLREPILLCCVEGLSYEDAATRMQSTAPAVRGRLARGRERLRDRLNRRGFAPSAMGVTGLFGQGATRLVVPAKLLMMTTQLSRAGTFPAGVEILAQGVIRTMIATKSKFLFAGLLTCGVAASGVGVYAQRSPGQNNAQVRPASTARAEAAKPVLSRMVMQPREEYSTDGGETWHPGSPAAGEPKPFETRPGSEPTEAPSPVPSAFPTPTPTPALASGPADPFDAPQPGQPLPVQEASVSFPPEQNPDDSRLGQLERKLDRVLEALEGGNRPVARRSYLTPTEPDVRPPAVDPQGAPIAHSPPGPARGSYGPIEYAEQNPGPQPTIRGDARPDRPRTGSNENRIDALEQQMGRLEARIVNIERRLNMPNPFDPQPNGHAASADTLQPFTSDDVAPAVRPPVPARAATPARPAAPAPPPTPVPPAATAPSPG